MTTAPPRHPAALEQLALHGGLLPAELRALGLSHQDAETLGMMRLDTVIGPMYIPRMRARAVTDKGRGITGRTTAAATDGAYLRLFMTAGALPGPWTVPAPESLGILKDDPNLLPSVQLGGETYRVCGKVLGNGMHPRTLRIYLQTHGQHFRRARERLLIVAPNVTRYAALANTFSTLLTLREFTAPHAKTINTIALDAHTQE